MRPDFLKAEDYLEPICPLCMDDAKTANTVPISRILDKLDSFFAVNDMEKAEQHLLYWKNEAESFHDLRGLFQIQNELIGIYRKTGQENNVISTAQSLLSLIDQLAIAEEIGGATAYINIATAYSSIDKTDEAINIFQKAKPVYESLLPANDLRLASLYNNMALAYAKAGQLDSAKSYFSAALDTLKNCDGSKPEQAITWLNIADLLDRKGSEENESEIQNCVETAYALLNDPTVLQNASYAYVCDKCSPVFGYYGFFLYEQEMKERAKRIYERS